MKVLRYMIAGCNFTVALLCIPHWEFVQRRVQCAADEHRRAGRQRPMGGVGGVRAPAPGGEP